MDWKHTIILFCAAALAGAVNSVAGGGTLLTFPALLWTGQLANIANATSTVALWPGQLSSLWGYRKELGQNRQAIIRLAIPSFLGGGLGALLFLRTPVSVFTVLVPYLILLATVLFMAQEPLARWQRARSDKAAQAQEGATVVTMQEPMTAQAWAGVMIFQFFVAIYGGYFGAGIGILMLAALGFMGFTNIHRMNGLKNINGLCINAVAATMFIIGGLVQWPLALLMAVGSIFGGYSGAGIAKKLGQKNVRRLIICIGFALTLSLLLKKPHQEHEQKRSRQTQNEERMNHYGNQNGKRAGV